MFPSRRSRVYVFFATLAVLLSLACGPLGIGTKDEPTVVPSATPEPTPTSPPEEPTPAPDPTFTPAPADQEEPDSPDASAPEDADLLECPPSGSTMILKFSAHIAIDYGPAHIEHNLEDGILGLMVEGDGAESAIVSSAVVPIPYNMSGTMEECSFSGEGTMTPSATGFCQNGIVYLTITENWGAFEGQMTCEDTTVPYNMPPMGVMTHSGADGNGEVFYLDKKFAGEGAGYTTIRPYAGPSGSGEHIWTLFYDYTGPVR